MRQCDAIATTTTRLVVTMNSGDPTPTLYELLAEAELADYYEHLRAGVLGLQVCSPDQLKLLEERHLRELGMTTSEQRRLRRHVDKHFNNMGYLGKIRQFLMGKQLMPMDRRGSTDFVDGSGGGVMTTTTRTMGEQSEPLRSSNGSPQHLIPRSHIILSEQLGAGEFGVVRQGVWMNHQHRVHVAVKCLACERLQSNAQDFLKEAAIMHGISHPNIVKLHGVVHSGRDLLLVTELAPFRSLLECLKEPGLAMHFCPRTLCTFGLQIAKGMAYLENRRMIHRDLAARNVLVFALDLVKISDFGLSRALGVGKDYYQTNFNVNLKLPIAWCAPESINFLKFTSASDAWAFGVTLWELFSFGQQPWRECSGHHILAAIDEPNCQRLEMPDACTRDVYAIMLKCWAHEPSHRPTFAQLVGLMASALPEQVQARRSSQSAPRPQRDALSFQQGDLITLLAKSTPELWKGFCHGSVGYFRASATAPFLDLNQPRSPLLDRAEGSSRQAKSKTRRPQRDSSSDMTPLLRQSLTEDTVHTPPFTQLNAPTSIEVMHSTTQAAAAAAGCLPSVRHEYHEISDDDLSPFDIGPPLCDDVFRGLEETESGTPGVRVVGGGWQTKEGSTSSASTVMDTRPLIKSRSPGHIVKPISPTDEQALDTAIHMAKEMASRTLQQAQQSSPSATPTRKHNGPRFFIFNTKSSQHDKKHFSEMLDNSKPLQDALPREVNDVYSALVEKGEIGCSLEESPPMDRVAGSASLPPGGTLEDIPPPLPPKPKVAVANPATLRHHRRIHPLILPGYELQDANNNDTLTKPPEPKDPEPRGGMSQTLPRLRGQCLGPINLANLSSRSSESLVRSLKCFGSSESLPCRPEVHPLRHEPLMRKLQPTGNVLSTGRSSVPDVGIAEGGVDFAVECTGFGAKPKKKLDRHVSCEDLLDFSAHRAAAKRTQGRERGADSDEVHIMQKVLADEKLPAEDCLDALNVAGWNVHKAIKLARLRRLLSRGETPVGKIPFAETKAVLETTGWNLDQAVQAIMGPV